MNIFILFSLSLLALFACGPRPDSKSNSQSSLQVTADAYQCNNLQTPAKISDLLGINVDLRNSLGRPSVTEMQELGMKWMRLEFRHRGGNYAASVDDYLGKGSDKKVSILPYKSAGIKIVLIVDYFINGMGYQFDMNDVQWKQYLATYRQNLEVVVQGLSGVVDVWQVWNEPDVNVPGYRPYLPEHRFAELLSISFEAIRKYSCKPIILGGLANGDFGTYLSKAIRHYKANNGNFPFAAIAVHPYGRGAKGIYNIFGPFDDFVTGYQKNALKPLGLNDIPIVISEAGTQEQDEKYHKAYVEAMYEEAFHLGLPFLTWFAWSDGMKPGFGLIKTNGAKRPSYEAFRTLKLN